MANFVNITTTNFGELEVNQDSLVYVVNPTSNDPDQDPDDNKIFFVSSSYARQGQAPEHFAFNSTGLRDAAYSILIA